MSDIFINMVQLKIHDGALSKYKFEVHCDYPLHLPKVNLALIKICIYVSIVHTIIFVTIFDNTTRKLMKNRSERTLYIR